MIFKLFILLILLNIQDSPKEFLAEIQKKYSSIEDLTADLNYGRSGKTKLFFKKKSFFRLEQNNRIIISNGTTNWNYEKKKNQVIISTVKDNTFSPEYYLFNLPENASLQLDKENVLSKLTFKPKGDNANFKTLMIWANSNYLIEKIKIVDLSDNEIEIKLSNIKINQNLNNGLFEFDKPKGVKVIDLR